MNPESWRSSSILIDPLELLTLSVYLAKEQMRSHMSEIFLQANKVDEIAGSETASETFPQQQILGAAVPC
ncbi:hypothetical protein Q9966_001232 [Columba livia]|nr:hypothetical protein Q9966_001232 [Columba livia]